MKQASAMSRWSTDVAKEMIRVIKAEEKRRLRVIKKLDQEFAWERWAETDQPFINELCLMLLVTAWHRIEQQVIRLAARVTDDGKMMLGEEYQKRVVVARKSYKRRRDSVVETLKLEMMPGWHSMETMRLIANCYKHDPSGKPDALLLQHLKLKSVRQRRPKVTYASLPDSKLFRESLAESLGLQESADYYDIVEELLNEADGFLDAVERQPVISPVRFGAVSLWEFVG